MAKMYVHKSCELYLTGSPYREDMCNLPLDCFLTEEVLEFQLPHLCCFWQVVAYHRLVISSRAAIPHMLVPSCRLEVWWKRQSDPVPWWIHLERALGQA